MKLDINYLRELLFELESCENIFLYVMDDFISGEDNNKSYFASLADKDDKKSYHIKLLYDADYLDKYEYRLTLKAHDFIEAVRGEDIWKETKKAISETGGNATLENVKLLAEGFLKKKISMHSGIDL